MSLDAHPVTLLSLGKVKMEDRKRSIVSDTDDLGPPAKRQAVNTGPNGTKAHADSELPWNDDIQNYQKDAILRQMREYKREKNTLEGQLADLQKKTLYHDDHLRAIDTWLSQFLDEVKILSHDFASLSDSKQPEEALFPASLLFSETERLQKHLSTRSENIKSALSNLFASRPTDAPDVIQLQETLSKALAHEKAHLAELHRVALEREQLSERLDKASYRYMVAEKKVDRAKSAVVQKLEAQAVQSSTASRGEETEQNKPESREVNGVSAVASEELVAARDEAIAGATKWKEHVDKLQAENQKLTQDLTDMQTKFASLTNEDYAKTELFQGMKQQYEEVIKRVNDLTATNVQLREEAQKYQAERTSFRTQIEEEQRAAISESEAQIAAAQADLARIRNERDEIITENQLKDAAKEEHKTSYEQIQELANSRKNHVEALEAEVQRLKVLTGEEKVEGGAELQALSADELREKIARLEAESGLLKAEIPSMEAAFSKYQALATKKTAEVVNLEERATRLSAEKAKADQKYFGAMKAKAAIEAENRTLRIQNGKSAEIITTLKDSVGANRSQVEKHEKRMAELDMILKKLSDEHREMQGKLGLQTNSTKGFMDQIAELKKFSVTKDTATNMATKSQREAESQVEELKVRLEATKKECDVWKERGQGNQSDTEKVLRDMLLCSVCKKNWRDTCIKLCGHVYCKECVEERLTSRSRKCPGCTKSFGANDLMKVHLT